MIGKTYRSRIKNSRRNIVAGLVKQAVIILSNFVLRTVIIHSLGAEYQGISGLFTSILQVLNLTDLGLASAVTFILYKPVSENDTASINAILSFLKKIYRIIGLIILIAGLAIAPFLPNLIHGEYPADINIYTLFGMYIINAVSSYWLFSYKSTFLTAVQRVDLVSNIYTIVHIVIKLLQILLLILLKDYYVYTALIPIGNIANNVVLELISRRAFPEIYANGTIDQVTKKTLYKQVKAVFINRLGDIARNSFDNIIISSFFGLIAVAAYDNYYYVYSALYGVMGIIIHSLWASIGNSIVTESTQKNYNDLLCFSFIFMWIVGFCTVCMFVLYQPFMNLWMKDKPELILPFFDMSLFCVYFYSISMTYTKNVYLESKGLFHESRYLYIFEAVGNLALNIFLGKVLGLTGILLATIFTILVFNFWGGTRILFKYYFKDGEKKFLFYHVCYALITISVCIVMNFISNAISVDGISGLLIRAVLCIAITNVIYFAIYSRIPQFNEAKKAIRTMLKR